MDVIALRTLTLTQQQVDRLKKLPLESEISNKESIIYQTDTLPRHKVEKDTLFKYLHIKDSILQKFSNRTGTSSWHYANENGTLAQKVSDTINSLSAKLKKKQEYASQRKDYRFFKCPTCKQKVRVPKGKGKIKIHCPRCHNDFIKKS